MISEKQGKDPRFYYIRVINLQLTEGSFNDNQILNLKMQLGSKFSTTTLKGSDFHRLPFPGNRKSIESIASKVEQEKEQKTDDHLNIFEKAFTDKKERIRVKDEGRASKIEDHLKRIREEAHIFRYGGQQFLNIFLAEKEDKEDQKTSKAKKKNKEPNIPEKSKQSSEKVIPLDNETKFKKSKFSKKKGDYEDIKWEGYSRILLIPLIQYPHIRHTVNAKLIGIKQSGEVTSEVVAKVTLEIYFRLDFKGIVDIIPMEAALGQNMVPVGDMRSVIGISCEGKKWLSLDSGGIHPHWSGYFHALRFDYESQTTSYSRITNIRNNLELSQASLQERNNYHRQNLSKKQEEWYFDIVRFGLPEAGSKMEIKIYSKPFTKEESPIVGKSQFMISNQGFFMFPTSDDDWGLFSTKVIDLFTEQEEPQFIGKLKLLVRFVFDKDNVLNCGPFKTKLGLSYQDRVQAEDKIRKEERIQELMVLNKDR